jgi:hypothetical protein
MCRFVEKSEHLDWTASSNGSTLWLVSLYLDPKEAALVDCWIKKLLNDGIDSFSIFVMSTMPGIKADSLSPRIQLLNAIHRGLSDPEIGFSPRLCDESVEAKASPILLPYFCQVNLAS